MSRIETAGNVPWASREEVLRHVDTVLHDSKLTDPERHRTWTGVGKVCIRATLALMRPRQNVVDYEPLPHMRFGVSKYGFLGRVYEMQNFEPPTRRNSRRCGRSSTRPSAAGRGRCRVPWA